MVIGADQKYVKKRSVVHSARKKLLQSNNSYYQISCFKDSCPCDTYCGRGFFSIFIQVIYGFVFAKKFSLPVKVDFKPIPVYGDPDLGPFWRQYFNDYVDKNFIKDYIPIENEYFETYPLCIWEKNHLRLLHEFAKPTVLIKEDIFSYLEIKSNQVSSQKTLAVHIRRTDHHVESGFLSLKSYYKNISKCLDNFDNVFVATDSEEVLNKMKKWFGRFLVYNDVIRSPTEQAVHNMSKGRNGYQLGLEALLDCYCISKSKMALLSNSNLSYAALIFNPDLPYRVLENWPSRIHRWKSSILFWLDELGIRRL